MPDPPSPLGRGGRLPLVGRDPELAHMDALLKGAESSSATLRVLGNAGIGKTALLDAAVKKATDAGKRVLRASGVQTESELAFAGLHQLLRPVLTEIDRLPSRQAGALRCAFGLSEETTPDRFLIGLATLTLLANVADQNPVVVVIDDAPWLDRESLEALAFAVRRLDAERIPVIVASRSEEAVAAFGRDRPRMVLGPLPDEASNQILDTRVRTLPGRLRAGVLTEAAGNPLALMELLSMLPADASGGTVSAAGLETTERLEHVFLERLTDLPLATRQLLTLAAATDGSDVQPIRRAATSLGLDFAAFGPAERAGLVTIAGDELQFRHPLVRSGVYHAATFEERCAAHLALVAALDGDPDRRAWHLAAVTLEADEAVAASLEATADRSRARAGFAAAASALERAAELSPEPAEQARRLVLAAQNAYAAGRGAWVEELAARLQALTDNPYLRAQVAVYLLGIQAPAGHGRGLDALTSSALEAAMADAPQIGVVLVIIAAGFAFLTGNRELAATAQRLVRQIPGAADEPWRLYVLAASDPAQNGRTVAPLVRRYVADPPSDPELLKLAAHIAWFIDQPDTAAVLLNGVVDDMRARGDIGELGTFLVTLGFTNVWRGRWLEARAIAAETIQVTTEVDQPLMAALGTALQGLVLALQGESGAARDQATAAIGISDAAFVVSVATWALGLAALAEGRHAEAHGHLVRMFAPGLPPAHGEVARWAIADYVEALLHIGATAGLVSLVDDALQVADVGASVRALLVARRAKALLATDGTAEALFEAAVTTEGADGWPFELARTQLSYGEWLRRNRRIVAARPLLGSALETFSQLGARSWAERARSELRATGVRLESKPRQTIEELTPQQQQIAQLAARGFTNQEIAAKLFLSPRTIGFHLYNVFPKLGITTRAQLAHALGEPWAP